MFTALTQVDPVRRHHLHNREAGETGVILKTASTASAW